MDIAENSKSNEKLRIIQESVPGRQITIAHIIANPDKTLYDKLGFENIPSKPAIGIVTITPAETSIIIADVAMKSSCIELQSVDRVNGTLIVTGTVSEVEAALKALIVYVGEKLNFNVCEVTKT